MHQEDNGLKKEQETDVVSEEMPLNEEVDTTVEESLATGSSQEESTGEDLVVASLTAERNQLKDQLLRAAADFDNYRKRMMRDQERQRKMAAETIARDLLPVMDNLERAIEHADSENGLAQGIVMTLNQFQEILEKHGVKPIEAVGTPFDPHVHDALMQVESADVPEGYVIQEFVKGYWMGDAVLRHSKVSVSKGAPSTNADIEAE